MFPQEVDVINIALVLPVFSPAVVKATSVWVLCAFGNGGGGWLDWGREKLVCVCVHVCVSLRVCVRVCTREHYRGGVQRTTLVG